MTAQTHLYPFGPTVWLRLLVPTAGWRLHRRAPCWRLHRRGTCWCCVALMVLGMTACSTAPTPRLIALPPLSKAMRAASPDPVPGPLSDASSGRLPGALSRPLPGALPGPLPGPWGTQVPEQRTWPPPEAVPQVLQVRRLTIPEYMMTRRVRFWSGAATLAEWPDSYWAERIEVGMAREFVAALRARLPDWSVCDGSCGAVVPQLVLTVDLLRLDPMRQSGKLMAQARSQLMTGAGDGRPQRVFPALDAAFTVPLSDDSAAGEAAGLSHLLTVMANTVASDLQRVQATTECVLPTRQAPCRGPE